MVDFWTKKALILSLLGKVFTKPVYGMSDRVNVGRCAATA